MNSSHTRTRLQLICFSQRALYNGITPASQAGDEGSTPFARTNRPLFEHYNVSCDLTGLQLCKTVVNGMQLHVTRDHVVEMQFSR